MPARQFIADVDELEERLSRPTERVVRTLAHLPGDIVLLGAGGKMGPTLARMAKRASDEAGVARRVIGVSRFGNDTIVRQLQTHGIETIRGDLLDAAFVDSLPPAPNVVYMAGLKFGTTGNEPLCWAMNTWLPSLVCRKFIRSRIVAFSTGNVYGPVPIERGGSVESDEPNPVGEYAMSCLGRERIFQFFSQSRQTPLAILRLNYACELRYGVLVDLAARIYAGQPIDVSVGHVNVIWQGTANAHALCALADAASPAKILNVAGPETLSVRGICRQIAQQLNATAQFTGEESGRALLSNASRANGRYGPGEVSAAQLADWIAAWISSDGETLGKPTHFEVSDGRF